MSWRSKRMEKKRLMKLYRQTWHSWGAGAYRNDKRNGALWRGYDYSSSHPNAKKWLRTYANRRFRRRRYNDLEKMDILQRGQHKKNFDLWWTLW